jgi:hypothetical protein
MRYALIQNGVVANVVEQNSQPTVPGQWVACGDAGPGWIYNGSTFANPNAPAVPAWSDPALDPRYHHIDVGRFNARLGNNAAAIGASTHDACKACVALLSMSKFVDLKGPEVSGMLDLLIATSQPAANPLFAGSGPITPALKTSLLNPVTTEYERFVKGMVQPT